YYPQQPPYGYQYGTVPPTYRITKADMLLEANSRRNRAIALIVVGTVLDVIGIAVMVDGLVHPYGDGFNINAFGAVNYFEDWLGASLVIVGVTLWAPGAASFAKASRRIQQVNAMPDNTVASSGHLPQAVMFNVPLIRF
ncbi:MAG TPA: hypothetical protein VFF06_14395, partial [Polyangia bacterium]|nr:hypothetical protein [Polyangia bacterium]